MQTQPKLERDDSPPDKAIATAAPERPKRPKPVVREESGLLVWIAFIAIVGVVAWLHFRQ